ncbi:MAG: SRPBCC family protein [Pararhizobium sp.]
MNDRPTRERPDTVRLRYELDAPPSKVWRAIRTPEFRDAWLPAGDLADPEPVSETAGQEVRYRMREIAPPHLESAVTLQIAPNGAGGTVLRVIHELTDAPCERVIGSPANSNDPPRMLAA